MKSEKKKSSERKIRTKCKYLHVRWPVRKNVLSTDQNDDLNVDCDNKLANGTHGFRSRVTLSAVYMTNRRLRPRSFEYILVIFSELANSLF